MTMLTRRVVVYAVALLGLVAGAAAPALAADELLLTAQDSGRLCISQGPLGEGPPPLVLELNAHALQWVSVKQDKAEIAERTAGDLARIYHGTLAIPGDKGGKLAFVEQIMLDAETLKAVYDVRPTAALSLCGLQLSINLDATAYQGAKITIAQVKGPGEGRGEREAPPAAEAEDEAAEPAGEDAAADGEAVEPAEVPAEAPAEEAKPVSLSLPGEVQQDKFVLFNGFVKKLEVQAANGVPFVITLEKPGWFVIQDNRKWDNPTFEIRLALEMNDTGVAIPVGKQYQAALAVKFAAPLAFAAAQEEAP